MKMALFLLLIPSWVDGQTLQKLSQLPYTNRIILEDEIVLLSKDPTATTGYRDRRAAVSNIVYNLQHGDKSLTNLSSGFITNLTVYDSVGGAITMRTNPAFPTTPSIDYLIPGNSMFFTFSKTLQDLAYGNLLVNAVHDSGGPSGNTVEFQFSSSHFIALGMANGIGSGHLQFGIGGTDNTHQWGGNYLMMAPQPNPAATNGHSAALAFLARSHNGAGATLSTKNPGIVAQVTDTNGPNSVYEMDFFPDLNNSGGMSTGLEDGKWDVRTMTTNGLRLIWDQLNPVQVKIDGKLFVNNDVRTFGSSFFGTRAVDDFSANDMSINHTLHLVSIGNGYNGALTINNNGGARAGVVLDVIGNGYFDGGVYATNGYWFTNQATPTAAQIGGTVGSRTNHMLKNVGSALIDYWSDGTTVYSKQLAP